MAPNWKLDFNDGPIYLQIAGEVQRMLVRGELQPGEKLPSARDLAQTLGVNPNTIVHAYGELEGQNISETRRGLGTFIRDNAPVKKLRSQLLADAAHRYLEEARGLGLSRQEAIEVLEELHE